MGDAEGETDIGALTGLFGALRAAGLRVVDLAEPPNRGFLLLCERRLRRSGRSR